jgi:hypothetical protein
MARSVTVQEIVDEVQILVEDPEHALATEGEYVRRVNRANARLYSYYVAAEPDRFRSESTITVAAPPNSATSALPDTWLATIGVDYASGTDRSPLRRLQEDERNDYAGQTGQADAFRVLGSNVVLYPTPVTGQTYIHIWIPTAPVIDDVADTIDCRLGHEEYLEYLVARTFLEAKREYDGRWDATIAKIEAELKLEANYRYFDDVLVMKPERHRRRGWPFLTPRGGVLR